MTYFRMAWTRFGCEATAAPVVVFKNVEIALLSGARRVMLVRLENWSAYGCNRVVKFDSCGELESTSVRDCPTAVEARARAIAAVFMLADSCVCMDDSSMYGLV